MPKILDSLSPVGEIKALTSTSAPDGYLICDGGTLGSSSSNATKTGQTYYDLYVFLWNNYTNAQLAIQDSSGNTIGVNRGANASADWTANKRMPLPNLIGRTLVGSGTYTDAVAGSTTRTLGDSLGNSAHKITTTEMPLHGHTAGSSPITGSFGFTDDTGGISVFAQNYMSGAFSGSSAVLRLARSSITLASALSTPASSAVYQQINLNATPTITVNQNGGDGTHNNMQPSHVTNWIIRY